MSEHLSSATLNALADGELAADDLASVKSHLDSCPACTLHALEQSLLKSATGRAGQRHAMPDDVRARMERLVSAQSGSVESSESRPKERRARLTEWAGWAVAATLLISAAGQTLYEIKERGSQAAGVESAALVTEVSDQHIATLAANLPPQVLSSDRHTVKPWFQGKIPFTFNLPENLPEDTKLEGANLTYLHNRPVAQLLYSIGRHRVSVFVQERISGVQVPKPVVEHAGFHVDSFSTDELDVVAISDVDPARLTGLIELIRRAQLPK